MSLESLYDGVMGPRWGWEAAVAAGKVSGWGPLNKFGYNQATGETEEDIASAGGSLAWQAAAAAHDIKSSDAADTNDSGTGARTVQVWGLDANYDEQTEIVELDGTTDVATASTYIRLFRMKVLTAGSGATAAGTITADVSATVHATITIGDNQTNQVGWTVPNGKTAYITRLHLYSGVALAQCTFRLLARPLGGVWASKFSAKVTAGSSSPDLAGLWQFPEKTDLRIAGTSASGNIATSAAMLGVFGPE
ncbi:MAG: hypothetical protein GY937_22920 [bacterium]|nr:hypothetical protein [bacterium]